MLGKHQFASGTRRHWSHTLMRISGTSARAQIAEWEKTANCELRQVLRSMSALPVHFSRPFPPGTVVSTRLGRGRAPAPRGAGHHLPSANRIAVQGPASLGVPHNYPVLRTERDSPRRADPSQDTAAATCQRRSASRRSTIPEKEVPLGHSSVAFRVAILRENDVAFSPYFLLSFSVLH